MKITFVLPTFSSHPSGGYKVVYEYANRLAELEHKVTIVHCAWALLPENILAPKRIKQKIKNYLRPYKYKYFPIKMEPSWFKFTNKVNSICVPYLIATYLPKSDVIVATAWQTAEWVRTYPNILGHKFYLIHDYEYYMTADYVNKMRMHSTYNSGMFNIVTSPATVEMLKECGATVNEYIPNGIDFKIFRLDTNIENRSQICIGFPSRSEKFKGTEDAIEALNIVRSKLGISLNVWSFGRSRLNYIPDWVEYYESPSDDLLRTLYNRSSIFVVASHYEGWGLPGAEAMACGATLVSTDNGGVRAYADHEKTSLLSPPKDPETLARNIIRLIQDPNLRTRLAKQGNQNIQQYTWEHAVAAFEKCLKQKL